MTAVCATDLYRERIAANPENGKRLMAMDPRQYIEVMSHWLDIFTSGGPAAPMMGVQRGGLACHRCADPGDFPVTTKPTSAPCGRAGAKSFPAASCTSCRWRTWTLTCARSPSGRRKRTRSPVPAPASCSRHKSRPDPEALHRSAEAAAMFEQDQRHQDALRGGRPDAAAPWVTFVTGIANDTTMWAEQARGRCRANSACCATTCAARARAKLDPRRLLGRAHCATTCWRCWDALRHRAHPTWSALGLGGSISIAMAIDHPQAPRSSVVPCCMPRQDGTGLRRHVEKAVRQGCIPRASSAIVEQTAQRWFTEEFKAAHPRGDSTMMRKMINGTSRDGYLGVRQRLSRTRPGR